jgi:hypothetical protein
VVTKGFGQQQHCPVTAPAMKIPNCNFPEAASMVPKNPIFPPLPKAFAKHIQERVYTFYLLVKEVADGARKSSLGLVVIVMLLVLIVSVRGSLIAQSNATV